MIFMNQEVPSKVLNGFEGTLLLWCITTEIIQWL